MCAEADKGVNVDLRYLVFFLSRGSASFIGRGKGRSDKKVPEPRMVVRLFAMIFVYIEHYWDKTMKPQIGDTPPRIIKGADKGKTTEIKFDATMYEAVYNEYVKYGSKLLPGNGHSETQYLRKLFPAWTKDNGLQGLHKKLAHYDAKPTEFCEAMRHLPQPAAPFDLVHQRSGPVAEVDDRSSEEFNMDDDLGRYSDSADDQEASI